MTDLMVSLRHDVQRMSRRILFPEIHDPRILEAARQFNLQGLGTAVLLSQPSEPVENIEIYTEDPNCTQWTGRCIEAYHQAMTHKGTTLDGARREVENNALLKGALLVRLGFADAGVSGSLASTADVVRAGIHGVGLASNSHLVSSFFLMQWADRVLAFADCAVNPEPKPKELAQIAIDTAHNYQQLTREKPVVALLSYSTKGSAHHLSIDKLKNALTLAQEMQPDLLIDGELQFDAAFVPEVAAIKTKGSSVAGCANVFIFPDLNSGNIAYKIAQRLGGAVALGPLLQGLSKPWMDLSRGCSVQDIIDVSVIAAKSTVTS